MEPSAYIPGACNIGPAEITMRKRVGWIGFALTVLVWAALTSLGAAPVWFSLLFIPSMISGAGFLQAKMHFCAAYGMRGLFNFGTGVGSTDDVLQAPFRAQHRNKALSILGYSALVGIAVAVAACRLRLIIP